LLAEHLPRIRSAWCCRRHLRLRAPRRRDRCCSARVAPMKPGVPGRVGSLVRKVALYHQSRRAGNHWANVAQPPPRSHKRTPKLANLLLNTVLGVSRSAPVGRQARKRFSLCGFVR
jgi:hypothetical protein